MEKTINQYKFKTYFDNREGAWFWVMFLNDEILKISKPYETEKEADKGLTIMQADLISTLSKKRELDGI